MTPSADATEITQLIVASLAEARAPAPDSTDPTHEAPPAPPLDIPAGVDPLQPYLNSVVAPKPDAAPEMVVEWLVGQIAGRLVDIDVSDVPGRRRLLDRSAAWWASQLPVGQHDAIDLAVSQLHLTLSTPARWAS